MGHTSPHYQECPVTSRRKTWASPRRRASPRTRRRASPRTPTRHPPPPRGSATTTTTRTTTTPPPPRRPRSSQTSQSSPGENARPSRKRWPAKKPPRRRWPISRPWKSSSARSLATTCRPPHVFHFTFLLLPCPETWLRGPKHEPLPGQVRSLSAMGPPTPSSSLSLPPSPSFSLSLSPLLFLLLIPIPILLRVLVRVLLGLEEAFSPCRHKRHSP